MIMYTHSAGFVVNITCLKIPQQLTQLVLEAKLGPDQEFQKMKRQRDVASYKRGFACISHGCEILEF